MKRKQAVLMAGILMVTAMAGCGKESLETIVGDTQKNVKEVSSASGDLDMEMGVNVGQSGLTMGLDLGLEGDWEAASDPGAFHFNGSVNMSLMKFQMDVEIYGVEEDGKMILYTKAADEWTKTVSELNAEDTENTKKVPEVEKDKMTMEDKTEEINGKEVYVLRSTVTGEEVQKALESAEETMGESLEKIDLADMELEVVMKVYKEDKLPASVTMDLKDGLQNLFSDEASGVQAGFEKLVLNVNVNDYNNIDKIEIPEEAMEAKDISGGDLLQGIEQGISGDDGTAGGNNVGDAGNVTVPENGDSNKDGALTDEPDAQEDEYSGYEVKEPEKAADGSYILTDYENSETVNIPVPEGFKVDYMESTYFSFGKEPDTEHENYISATYRIVGLDEYYSEEDYVNNFLSQEKDYEEYGYKSLVCTEPQTLKVSSSEVSYMTMEYSFSENDKTKVVNYWMELDDTHLLQCSVSESVFESELSMEADDGLAEALFSGVTFAEESAAA